MTDVTETLQAFGPLSRQLLDQVQYYCSYPAGARFGWFRLVLLEPSQQIVKHRDAPIAGRRFHIPIWTSDDAWSYYAGGWWVLQTGTCYEMDPTQPHGAVNWGDQVRIHLLMDVEAV